MILLICLLVFFSNYHIGYCHTQRTGAAAELQYLCHVSSNALLFSMRLPTKLLRVLKWEWIFMVNCSKLNCLSCLSWSQSGTSNSCRPHHQAVIRVPGHMAQMGCIAHVCLMEVKPLLQTSKIYGVHYIYADFFSILSTVTSVWQTRSSLARNSRCMCDDLTP